MNKINTFFSAVLFIPGVVLGFVWYCMLSGFETGQEIAGKDFEG